MWVLVAGVFVNRAGSFFSVFVVLFLTARGFRPTELPLVLLGVAGTGLAGSLGGGWLADRVGRKPLLVGSMVAAGMSLAGLSVASGRGQTVAAVWCVGLFTQSYVPAASALLVDHCAPEDRVPVFALFRLTLNLGAAIGPLLAGILAPRSYTVLFGVDSGTCLLVATLLALGLPTVRRAPGPASRSTPSMGRRSPGAGLPVLCVALFLVAVVYAQYSSTLPLRLAADGGSLRYYGSLVAFNAVLVIALELPVSTVTRRFLPRLPLTVGAVLISVGMALSGTAPAGGLVFAAVALWSLGEMVLAPVASAAVAALSSPDRIARDQGFLATAQTLGFSLGPVVGIYTLSLDAALPWLGCLVVGGLALPLLQVALPPNRSAPSTIGSASDVPHLRYRRRPPDAGRAGDPHRPRRLHEPARRADPRADPGIG